jgi:hypothetical protein
MQEKTVYESVHYCVCSLINLRILSRDWVTGDRFTDHFNAQLVTTFCRSLSHRLVFSITVFTALLCSVFQQRAFLSFWESLPRRLTAITKQPSCLLPVVSGHSRNGSGSSLYRFETDRTENTSSVTPLFRVTQPLPSNGSVCRAVPYQRLYLLAFRRQATISCEFILSFMVYLMTLSVTLTIRRRMIGGLMNNELEWMWRKRWWPILRDSWHWTGGSE